MSTREEGTWTPSRIRERIRSLVPEDMTGRSVLDIGCNGGFHFVERADGT